MCTDLDRICRCDKQIELVAANDSRSRRVPWADAHRGLVPIWVAVPRLDQDEGPRGVECCKQDVSTTGMYGDGPDPVVVLVQL